MNELQLCDTVSRVADTAIEQFRVVRDVNLTNVKRGALAAGAPALGVTLLPVAAGDVVPILVFGRGCVWIYSYFAITRGDLLCTNGTNGDVRPVTVGSIVYATIIGTALMSKAYGVGYVKVLTNAPYRINLPDLP